ncbi:hypothetical protein [Burkholderia sp. MSMB0856]|uniref:hypothetical protein n=1 Tax=Burkholderia sp. MSMB0856 TaxID=1637869 RepID=UPI000AB6C055|nr:hypothetical protein [Burkholderia sp. MSMB0856]
MNSIRIPLPRVEAPRLSRIRRAIAATFWMLLYGAAAGLVLYVAYLIGEARLQ